MSISRQRSRTRVNSRSNTILSSNNASFMPSIEESLQDWLSKNTIPDTPSSYSLDMCQCCKQHDCQNFESIHSIIRKLENDVRLAAVIGQSLLQKHEQYVTESNDIKNQLEQEVNQKEKRKKLKGRVRVKEKRKKQILDETTFDLDMCNNRCLELGAELKNSINEVEKLRVFKFMVRQADIREEVLKTKLEDTKQELAISRKAELTLESKHRKLKAKYGKYRMTSTCIIMHSHLWMRREKKKLPIMLI
ncbi:MAG: hypothetical protein EXX96DRAFT_472089 [Benjaminiella poitrasii]|nr:MAG: hypothetical protein EXX96DRAFT_472089 [Benjaminiella poitrasii]